MTTEDLDSAITALHLATIDILEGSRDTRGFVYLACNFDKVQQDYERIGDMLSRIQKSFEVREAAE